jgi:bacterioferritin-associated ferredoxin
VARGIVRFGFMQLHQVREFVACTAAVGTQCNDWIGVGNQCKLWIEDYRDLLHNHTLVLQ